MLGQRAVVEAQGAAHKEREAEAAFFRHLLPHELVDLGHDLFGDFHLVLFRPRLFQLVIVDVVERHVERGFRIVRIAEQARPPRQAELQEDFRQLVAQHLVLPLLEQQVRRPAVRIDHQRVAHALQLADSLVVQRQLQGQVRPPAGSIQLERPQRAFGHIQEILVPGAGVNECQPFAFFHRECRFGKHKRAHRSVLADEVVRQAQVAVRAVQVGCRLRDAGIYDVALFHHPCVNKVCLPVYGRGRCAAPARL